jgi:hypothetical protein
VADADLGEISGAVASRSFPGVWWVHDDSGGPAALSAIGDGGEDLGTYDLPGIEAFDWEDIAARGRQLYVADTGDNGRQRKDPRVFRVTEPDARPDGGGGTFGHVDAFHLVYPDGPVDAEALLVDPRTGDLLVLTKELGRSHVLMAGAGELRDGARVAMREVASFDVPSPRSTALGLPGSLVTGADVSPDGRTVLVRTYRAILAFTRPAGKPLAAAFAGPPCEVPQVDEPQGEAVAWSSDGRSYLFLSEGPHVAVHRVAAVAPEATTTTAAPGGAAATSRRPLAVLVGALAAAGLVVLLVSRARRAGRRRTRGSPRP